MILTDRVGGKDSRAQRHNGAMAQWLNAHEQWRIMF